MIVRLTKFWAAAAGIVFLSAVFLVTGCSRTETAVPAPQTTVEEAGETDNHAEEHADEIEMLTLPELEAVELGNEPLKIVATTNIIGDVVSQVGGDAVEVTTLMGPGQDPHSYEPGARELAAAAEADVIFVNGWDLEEGLVRNLEAIAEDIPVVAISANITPLPFGDDEHGHGGADPHVWFDVRSVEQWTKNVADVLSDLDPANAETFQTNATDYLVDLGEVEAYARSQLAQIPEEKRFLVTNHDSFAYFADAYGFTILGTVLPGLSTLAEPSASDLAALIEKMEENGVCTLFTETTISDALANTVATELQGCDEVKVVPLNTGTIGVSGSGINSYIDMIRANADAVVSGLQ